jgi:Lipocalin-like domain
MSVQIMGSEGDLAYAGRYEIDEQTMTHHPEVSLARSGVGRPLRRSVELDGVVREGRASGVRARPPVAAHAVRPVITPSPTREWQRAVIDRTVRWFTPTAQRG